ncbi:TPA: ABC-F family ATP-binding cassette domain-containing protein [Candidatus Pacearchaeota archaeon]|jgi:ATP-binding cassette subfamily F protein 3|nr:ABC-F family ATP-binding cassette domain-containing protein [Candidatus Pacearchaeota archaeon]
MIKIQNLSMIYGKEPLFEDVNLIIKKGEKIALIGQNGTGKTTFIKCISGEVDFEGKVEILGTMRISMMEQEKNFSKTNSNFSEYLEEKRELYKEKVAQIESKLSEPSLYENQQELDRVIQQHETILGGSKEKIEEVKLKKILREVETDMASYTNKIKNLSGGQKTKLRIAECLAKEADLYILDEPTNHLDIETTQWLEQWVSKSNATFILVSHDRQFLKNTVNKFLEIENKKMVCYNGNYETYLKSRNAHIEKLRKDYREVNKKRKQLLESAAEKRRWAVSGSRDSRHRKMAERMERQAAELPEVFDPDKFTQEFRIDFESALRAGSTIFDAHNINKSFGDKIIFQKCTFEVERGEKIGVVGLNGTGKSTLIKLLYQMEASDSGTIKIGNNARIGYFDQELADIDTNQTVEEFLIAEFGDLAEHKMVGLAIRYGINRESFPNKLKTLSGGEKSRINLVRLMVRKYNVLLFDEPTNNLDIELIRSLEKALQDYRGTIVFISHDRYFIDKVAEKIISIENNKIKVLKGNYSENF